MRLVGERVQLLPVPRAVATAVVAGQDPGAALREVGLTAADWPHRDTADALRPLAEHGQGEGTFLVVLDGQVVGECGRLRGPDDEGSAEIGYGLSPAARGRGLATDAVRVLTAWLDTQPGVRRITAEALVGNAPSRRLLLRLGFTCRSEVPPYACYARDSAHVDRPGQSG